MGEIATMDVKTLLNNFTTNHFGMALNNGSTAVAPSVKKLSTSFSDVHLSHALSYDEMKDAFDDDTSYVKVDTSLLDPEEFYDD